MSVPAPDRVHHPIIWDNESIPCNRLEDAIGLIADKMNSFGAGMLFYQNAMGTSPRRVIIYMREKGIDVPRYDVDLAGGEQRSETFLAMNPAGKVPVLKLDDGTTITESAAIVEYLEELHPHPPMIGTTPAARGRVRALERIAGDLIVRASLWFMHGHPHFAGRLQQQPAIVAVAKPFAEELLGTLEAHLGDRPFLAGEEPTIADCTLFALFQTCRERFAIRLGSDRPGLDAWYRRFAERPSAAY